MPTSQKVESTKALPITNVLLINKNETEFNKNLVLFKVAGCCKLKANRISELSFLQFLRFVVLTERYATFETVFWLS